MTGEKHINYILADTYFEMTGMYSVYSYIAVQPA